MSGSSEDGSDGMSSDDMEAEEGEDGVGCAGGRAGGGWGALGRGPGAVQGDKVEAGSSLRGPWVTRRSPAPLVPPTLPPAPLLLLMPYALPPPSSLTGAHPGGGILR